MVLLGEGRKRSFQTLKGLGANPHDYLATRLPVQCSGLETPRTPRATLAVLRGKVVPGIELVMAAGQAASGPDF